MAQAVEDWYKQMPIITRSYVTAAVVTTIGCSLDREPEFCVGNQQLIPKTESGTSNIPYQDVAMMESVRIAD